MTASASEDPNSVREVGDGVTISVFDESVENFFSTMGTISELCGMSREESFEASQIDHFSSMITFWKQWRPYYYEPKIINFAYETGSAQGKDAINGISLSHFSSATVPKIEQEADKARFLSSKDFVLHAGGPVWALDWCPRVHEHPDYTIKCEYLAVSAHPPDSAYHHFGVPLTGRGVIQIWCVLIMNEKEELPPPKPRGNPKKKPVEPLYDLNGKEMSSAPRPRGRPRKMAIEKEPVEPLYDSNGKEASSAPRPRKIAIENVPLDDLNGTEKPVEPLYDLNGNEASSALRPRGRPRKISIEKEPSDDLIGTEVSCLPRPRGRPRKRPVVGVSSIPRLRGRPRKKPFLGGDDLNGEKELSSPRGRPVKGLSRCVNNLNDKEESPPPSDSQILSVNKCIPAFNVELGEAVSVLPPLGEEVSSMPRRRGRPRKRPIFSANACVPASGTELEENTSLLPTVSGLETTCENAVQGRCQTAEAFMTEKYDDFNNERLAIKSVSPACKKKQRMKDKARVFTCNDATYPVLSTVNGMELAVTVVADNSGTTVPLRCQTDGGFALEMCGGFNNGSLQIKSSSPAGIPKRRLKDIARAVTSKNSSYPILPTTSEEELSATVAPTHDNHFQDAVVLSKEVAKNRSLEDDVNSYLIPKEFALPRVVLCLAHNGKIAWDVKWKPLDVNASEGKHHMGYLAVLLGNGSLEVWDVPLPSMVKVLYSSCSREGADPRFLITEPVFRCSKVKHGDRQSIPLTVEWSPSASGDLILAGCHDGTVALWKFSAQCSSQDTKPFLCFTADTVPIRALAWAPEESGAETNLIATAGPEGLKFWDVRDPYRPLWDFNPVQRTILSLDWVKKPRCVIMSYDEGTIRIISSLKAAYDAPVTGKPFDGTRQPGVRGCGCSDFAIWSVHVSRITGLAAYCSADGYALCFQLTDKFVDGDSRNCVPLFPCGSLKEEGQAMKISTPLPNTRYIMKKPQNLRKDAASVRGYVLDLNQAKQASPLVPDDCAIVLGSGKSFAPTKKALKPRNINKKKKPCPGQAAGQECMVVEAEQETLHSSKDKAETKQENEKFPAKIEAMHRVRWNMNKGCERWLCYGGAAGIIRCQEICLTTAG